MRIKGIRKHRGYRVGIVEYKYSTYMVRLEEGSPPAVRSEEMLATYEARAKKHIDNLRKREIHVSI
jgi:hypothetical protein